MSCWLAGFRFFPGAQRKAWKDWPRRVEWGKKPIYMKSTEVHWTSIEGGPSPPMAPLLRIAGLLRWIINHYWSPWLFLHLWPNVSDSFIWWEPAIPTIDFFLNRYIDRSELRDCGIYILVSNLKQTNLHLYRSFCKIVFRKTVRCIPCAFGKVMMHHHITPKTVKVKIIPRCLLLRFLGEFFKFHLEGGNVGRIHPPGDLPGKYHISHQTGNSENHRLKHALGAGIC